MTGRSKGTLAPAVLEEDKLGAEIAEEGVVVLHDDKALKLEQSFSAATLSAARTRTSLLSPPGSKGKDSLVGSETASESVPSTSFALLISGVVGALPRLVAAANGWKWDTDSLTSRQNSSFSSVNS